ncbi:unnamed protein product [Brassica oleracea var. botrytis]|uniref:Protein DETOXIFICATION n=1 Tax=Brassica oleracea TaxID=3712 RepID=A0A3P6DRK3_BRAOL|nr:unnamed protein product [Brassica oleracea]
MADIEMAPLLRDQNAVEEGGDIWIETKKLWSIVGPAIFTRVKIYLFFLITQSFAGHLGELELAAISIVINIIIGFTYGLLLVFRSFSILLLPMFFFAAPILQFLGQPEDIAQLSGTATVLAIPLHFAFVFVCPINRFLQCQLKNEVLAITAGATLVVHIFVSWLFVYGLKLGFIWTMITFTLSWWLNAIILFVYIVWGGCPLTWTGFSMEAFMGLWEYAKLSASSGIMLWILILMTGNLEDAKTAVDSLSICMSINGLEMMIPLAFFAGAG